MSKTITIDDETYERFVTFMGITEDRTYPIATIRKTREVGDSCLRLILNLSDGFLADTFKGKIFSIDQNGRLGMMGPKSQLRGTFYDVPEYERQIFPVEEDFGR
uniref:Uncharacterized protein n=1 Tax=viral metagenome TaxID=1070528 RepID=A0A6M3KQU8_9ZZZZ